MWLSPDLHFHCICTKHGQTIRVIFSQTVQHSRLCLGITLSEPKEMLKQMEGYKWNKTLFYLAHPGTVFLASRLNFVSKPQWNNRLRGVDEMAQWEKTLVDQPVSSTTGTHTRKTLISDLHIHAVTCRCPYRHMTKKKCKVLLKGQLEILVTCFYVAFNMWKKTGNV